MACGVSLAALIWVKWAGSVTCTSIYDYSLSRKCNVSERFVNPIGAELADRSYKPVCFFCIYISVVNAASMPES